MLNFEHENFAIPLERFEKMLKTNELLFFDAQEFEGIVQHYIDYGKLNLADRALEIGMDQHPNNGELILLKSEILIFEGDFKQSLELLDLAEKISPQHEEVFIQKATIASKSKKHKEAIKLLKLALKFSDDLSEIWSLIGMEYLLIKNFISAKYYFKLCLEKDPFDYQALYNLLHIFEQLSEENESINFLNKILEKNPYCEVAWHQLGKIYFKKDNYKDAISAFDFAIISDDTFTGAYIEKGKILEKIGEEATEVILSAKDMTQTGASDALVNEVADLWFHTLVMLSHLDLNHTDVLNVLDSRMGLSGLAEKAARKRHNADSENA